MPNAIWTGSLSFGLVVIPVRLHPAIRKKAVRFREVDSRGRRLRRMRIPEDEPGGPPAEISWDGSRIPTPQPDPERRFEVTSRVASTPLMPRQDIPVDEVLKGFEVAPGQFVSLTREELRELAPERSRSIDVERFVNISDVDPIYFESRYFVSPERDADAAYALLSGAMAESGRMAIASFTMRSRRYVSAIRPYQNVMLLTTMVHADEVLPAEEWTPRREQAPTDRELKMARMLVDTMAGPFEPELYTDEHRERLLEAIARRAPEVAPVADIAASPARVLDLMAALEASVKGARAARATEDERANRKPARRHSRRGA